MTDALHAFMTGLIDYAGLFPPAALDLEPALRTFVRDCAGADAWMLGRFICPAARLAELRPFAELLAGANGPLEFAVLGRGTNDYEETLALLRDDAMRIQPFLDAHPGHVKATAFELRLPATSVDDGAAAAISGALAALANAPHPLAIFVEVPRGGDWRARCRAVATACAHHRVGFKLRTGGTEAAAFPNPAEVAAAIAACRDAGAPFKATAGLHHPLPRRDAATGGAMHGFFNVFGAALLAHAAGLAETEIAEAVADPGPQAFIFDAAGLAWRGHRVPVAEIARLRRTAVLSFGSCSFDEPREDLAALGLR